MGLDGSGSGTKTLSASRVYLVSMAHLLLKVRFVLLQISDPPELDLFVPRVHTLVCRCFSAGHHQQAAAAA